MFRTLVEALMAFALLVRLAALSAVPAQAQLTPAYRLIDVLWQQTGTGPSRGLDAVQWLQQPTATGGRVEIKVINPNNAGCAEKEQTFQLGWSFDQSIQTVAYGQSFRMLPSVSKTTPGPSCYDAYYLAAGDQNGMLSPLLATRDQGTGPGGAFFASEGYDRIYAPARAGQPQSTRFTVSDRDTPRRAFFHMYIGAWSDVEFNVVYVFEQAAPPAPAPQPAPQPVQPAPPPAQLAGPISWWPASGDANDAIGPNHGTLQNGTTIAEGGNGQSFIFDGTDDFITAGNPPTLRRAGGDFTVMAWVNVADLTAPPGSRNVACVPNGSCDMPIVNKMIASNRAGANSDGWRLLKQVDNRFWFCLGVPGNGCGGGKPTTIQSATEVQPGVWYHVAASRSAAGIALYINGVLEASAGPSSNTDTDAADFLIGYYPAESYMYGQIDDVKFFDRALPEAEIQAVAQP